MTRGGGLFLILPDGLMTGLLLVDEFEERGVLMPVEEVESSSNEILT